MKYLGHFPGQDINLYGYKTLYCHTSIQEREVIGYYVYSDGYFCLKQIAICSEMTNRYSMYWVFLYEYNNKDFDDFKRGCLKIVEEELLPHIQYCVENKIPITTTL